MANRNSLMMLIKAIDQLKKKNSRVELHIYSPNIEDLKIGLMEGVKPYQAVNHKKIPSLLQQYDLVYLPLDFDKKSIDYSRFSMPTKISEYMISGLPILINAPQDTAVYQYAEKNQIAFLCKNNTIKNLSGLLLEIKTDTNQRETYGQTARNLAMKDFDIYKVRDNFRDALKSGVRK